MKKWLNIPSRGVTNASLFHPYLLNIKQPSQVYHEGHTGNLALMQIKGDKTVQACIQSKLQRESRWTNKSSTVCKSYKIIAQIVAKNAVQTTQERTTSTKHKINKTKLAVKRSIQEEVKEKWNNSVRKLTLQGEFTKLLIEENESVTWQSIIRKMPRNVMSFAARMSTNSLATPSNLVRWGKRRMGTCPLCSYPNATLAHITNVCPVSLNQGRFTWRHDSVLHHTVKYIKSQLTTQTEVYAELEGWRVNGGTIPADILVSGGKGSKPDIVLVDRSTKKALLLELTCSLPQSTISAHKKKHTTYTQLSIALKEKGFTVGLLPFEVCSNGHITNKNKQDISKILFPFNVRLKTKIFTELAQISLLCSMSIFYAYQTTDRTSPPLLSP